ncbi:MAG: TetR/AcrR family transcriptional regulator [Gammaproteobacteria bacterium]|nr:TetR/AcrR family transcriptional regulator [Gammaproteobacteria bacterium]
MDDMTKNLWQSIVKSPVAQKPPERKRQDKKYKLIVAAKTLIHKKGFAETTLADIAHEADVPLGNVYYYFKTKEAIGLAVIDQRLKDWEVWRKKAMQHPLALKRLQFFLENFLSCEPEVEMTFPMGHLCEEFSREGGALAIASKKFLKGFIDWLEEQCQLLGLAEHALTTTYTFLSMAQGATLLGQSLQDDTIVHYQRVLIERWLKGLDRHTIQKVGLVDLPQREYATLD